MRIPSVMPSLSPTISEPTDLPTTVMPSTSPTQKPTDECECFRLEQLEVPQPTENLDLVVLLDSSSSIIPDQYAAFMQALAHTIASIGGDDNDSITADTIRLGFSVFATQYQRVVTAYFGASVIRDRNMLHIKFSGDT